MSELVRALREGGRGQQAGTRQPLKNLTGAAARGPAGPTSGTVCPLCSVVLPLWGPSQGHLEAPSFQGTRLLSLVTSCSTLSPSQDFSPHSSPSLTPLPGENWELLLKKTNKNNTKHHHHEWVTSTAGETHG